MVQLESDPAGTLLHILLVYAQMVFAEDWELFLDDVCRYRGDNWSAAKMFIVDLDKQQALFLKTPFLLKALESL